MLTIKAPPETKNTVIFIVYVLFQLAYAALAIFSFNFIRKQLSSS